MRPSCDGDFHASIIPMRLSPNNALGTKRYLSHRMRASRSRPGTYVVRTLLCLLIVMATKRSKKPPGQRPPARARSEVTEAHRQCARRGAPREVAEADRAAAPDPTSAAAAGVWPGGGTRIPASPSRRRLSRRDRCRRLWRLVHPTNARLLVGGPHDRIAIRSRFQGRERKSLVRAIEPQHQLHRGSHSRLGAAADQGGGQGCALPGGPWVDAPTRGIRDLHLSVSGLDRASHQQRPRHRSAVRDLLSRRI